MLSRIVFVTGQDLRQLKSAEGGGGGGRVDVERGYFAGRKGNNMTSRYRLDEAFDVNMRRPARGQLAFWLAEPQLIPKEVLASKRKFL